MEVIKSFDNQVSITKMYVINQSISNNKLAETLQFTGSTIHGRKQIRKLHRKIQDR